MDEVDEQLLGEIRAIRAKNLPPSRQFVGLIIDEMKVKEGLVYNKWDGKVIDINDELMKMDEEEQKPVAKQILVLMVLAHFGTKG